MAVHFGERLQRLRDERGWTVSKAARRGGLSPQLLFKLEAARALGNIQVATVRKLATLYGLPLDYLVRDVLDEVPDDEEEAHDAA
jgi:transcriptional regulator with XRE-family HTH domain